MHPLAMLHGLWWLMAVIPSGLAVLFVAGALHRMDDPTRAEQGVPWLVAGFFLLIIAIVMALACFIL